MSRPYRILILEDDPDAAWIWRSTLEPTHACLTAANGIEGFYLALVGEPDIIVSDIMMPSMDGYQFITQLRKDPAHAATPVVFISALSSTDDIRKGYDLGATVYLTKPISNDQLEITIENLIRDCDLKPKAPRFSIDEVQEALHRAVRKSECRPADSPAPGAEPDAPVRLLVVDRDPHLAGRLRAMVGPRYRVVAAHEGVEAVERAVRYGPDILLVEEALPEMGGLPFIAMMKRHALFRHAPIILLSSQPKEPLRSALDRQRVVRVLTKPLEAEVLREALEACRQEPDFHAHRRERMAQLLPASTPGSKSS